ncbi:hypothetical protein Tco_1215259 [Tanacetum coccineum]
MSLGVVGICLFRGGESASRNISSAAEDGAGVELECAGWSQIRGDKRLLRVALGRILGVGCSASPLGGVLGYRRVLVRDCVPGQGLGYGRAWFVGRWRGGSRLVVVGVSGGGLGVEEVGFWLFVLNFMKKDKDDGLKRSVKGWLDEDLDNYHLKELRCSTQCHTQMSMWIISRGVVLLILLMEYKVLRDFLLHRSSINNSARLSNKFGGFYFSFKFDISGLLHHVITTIAYRIRDKDTSQSKQNLQSSSMTFIHKTLIIPSVLDSCFISSTVSEVKRYSANMRRTDADFSHAPPNEYSPSPDDKKQ